MLLTGWRQKSIGEEFECVVVQSDKEANEIKLLLEKQDNLSLFTNLKILTLSRKEVIGLSVSLKGKKLFT